MIANATRIVLHDPGDDSGDVDDPDLDPALLEDLARDRLGRGFAELDEAAGQAPLTERRRLAPADEQHLVLVQDDSTHTHPRVVRVLAAHARPSRQASVPYFSATRRSTLAASPALSPSGRRRTPCSLSNAAASAVATSSNFARWPSAASSVVKVASGSAVLGKIAASRGASTPSRMDPCWTKVCP